MPMRTAGFRAPSRRRRLAAGALAALAVLLVAAAPAAVRAAESDGPRGGLNLATDPDDGTGAGAGAFTDKGHSRASPNGASRDGYPGNLEDGGGTLPPDKRYGRTDGDIIALIGRGSKDLATTGEGSWGQGYPAAPTASRPKCADGTDVGTNGCCAATEECPDYCLVRRSTTSGTPANNNQYTTCFCRGCGGQVQGINWHGVAPGGWTADTTHSNRASPGQTGSESWSTDGAAAGPNAR